jgi:aspartate/methionine/tyrosine aminotransferase
VDADAEVTVTSGCTEAIPAAILGLVDPGDEVVVFEPYYDSYPACLSMAGAVPRFVTLRPPDYAFDPDELRAAFSPRTRAVIINTPHNPTGKVYTREELELIAGLCREHDAIAITDEVYERLVFEGEHVRMASIHGMRERTVSLSSLGKTFSLTGWKIGWAVAPPPLTAGVRAAHQFLTYATATPFQHGAVEPPAGTYFVLADHTPFGFPDDVRFCKHLIEEVGVAAIPPSAFYHDPADGASLVRFAFCKDLATLDEAVRRMRERLRPR